MATTTIARPLAATSAPMIVMSMNNMVMNNALPSIGVELSAHLDATKWIITAYTFVFATLLLVATRIGDHVGRRSVFRAGTGLFVVASVGCAVAPSLPFLIACRALQAAGAAAVVPLSLVLLTAAVDDSERGRAIGWWSGANGLAIALGPVVGGTITGALGWRYVFWVNVAVGVLSLLLSRAVPGGHTRVRTSPDVPGMAGVTAFIVLLMAAVSQQDLALLALIAAGIVLIVPVLVLIERRAVNPVLAVRLYRQPALLLTYAVSLTMFFAIMGTTVLSSQYLQHAQGYSPLQAGLASLPSTATPMIAAPLAGLLLAKVGGGRLMTVGLVLISAGLSWLAINTTVQLNYFLWAPGLLLAGTGLGIEMTASNAIVLGAVPAGDRGGATAMNTTVVELGGALGISALVGFFQLTPGVFGSAAQFVVGLRPTILLGAVIAGCGAIAAGILARRYDPTREPAIPVRLR